MKLSYKPSLKKEGLKLPFKSIMQNSGTKLWAALFISHILALHQSYHSLQRRCPWSRANCLVSRNTRENVTGPGRELYLKRCWDDSSITWCLEVSESKSLKSDQKHAEVSTLYLHPPKVQPTCPCESHLDKKWSTWVHTGLGLKMRKKNMDGKSMRITQW